VEDFLVHCRGPIFLWVEISAGNSINPHIIPIILISYGLLQSPFNLNGVENPFWGVHE
jgi:hypothetical protein